MKRFESCGESLASCAPSRLSWGVSNPTRVQQGATLTRGQQVLGLRGQTVVGEVMPAAVTEASKRAGSLVSAAGCAPGGRGFASFLKV